jgi:hypothetical protein
MQLKITNSNQRIVLALLQSKMSMKCKLQGQQVSMHVKWGIKDLQVLMWHKFEIQTIESLNCHDSMEYKWCVI